MAQQYHLFCSVARGLEKIGEKWTLLIVRDLLRGPQRFTDLLKYSNGITSARLTQRLQEMEKSGLVERNSKPGHREVWYRLTPAGRELEPVIEAISKWGLHHAMRPPAPGDYINLEDLMIGFTNSLNNKGKSLSGSVHWLIRFPMDAYTIIFSKKGWSQSRGEKPDADLTIAVTPEEWAALVTVERSERGRWIKKMQIEGTPQHIREFYQLFGVSYEN